MERVSHCEFQKWIRTVGDEDWPSGGFGRLTCFGWMFGKRSTTDCENVGGIQHRFVLVLPASAAQPGSDSESPTPGHIRPDAHVGSGPGCDDHPRWKSAQPAQPRPRYPLHILNVNSTAFHPLTHPLSPFSWLQSAQLGDGHREHPKSRSHSTITHYQRPHSLGSNQHNVHRRRIPNSSTPDSLLQYCIVHASCTFYIRFAPTLPYSF